MGSFVAAEALAQLHGPGDDTASVEMKSLLVPPAGAAAEALTGRPSPTWSVRESYLVDTPSLDLIRAGVEIRLRRRARGRFDLCVSTRRSGTTRAPEIPGVRAWSTTSCPGACGRTSRCAARSIAPRPPR